MSFGLAPEEIETLQTQMNVDKKSKDEEALKKQKELQDQQKALKTQVGKNVADADLKALKALRDQAALDLEYTTVKALNSGTVTKKNGEKGRIFI